MGSLENDILALRADPTGYYGSGEYFLRSRMKHLRKVATEPPNVESILCRTLTGFLKAFIEMERFY